MPSLKHLTAAALTAATFAPVVLTAQEKTTPSISPHYKLTYRLLEVGADGKVSNSRTYVAIVGTGQGEYNDPAKIRAGDKLPIPVKSGTTNEYQYQDVGTDIDTLHAQVQDRQLSLHVSAAYSSVAKSSPLPVFRQTRWESNVVVTLDKPTIIFSSENVSDTGKTELELTATEIH